ncbi:hypothetical protein H6P81_009568 [Aristolochia fimbriata]|uniref:Uncharacterized protein n=1 Tax=Aristolochia fimbriata TaxID=158543 RepID=A0AAV7EL99_ARIFI|nr:hypothetical protein H6P81_009568 [Aristolochia fimbriata]
MGISKIVYAGRDGEWLLLGQAVHYLKRIFRTLGWMMTTQRDMGQTYKQESWKTIGCFILGPRLAGANAPKDRTTGCSCAYGIDSRRFFVDPPVDGSIGTDVILDELSTARPRLSLLGCTCVQGVKPCLEKFI